MVPLFLLGMSMIDSPSMIMEEVTAPPIHATLLGDATLDMTSAAILATQVRYGGLTFILTICMLLWLYGCIYFLKAYHYYLIISHFTIFSICSFNFWLNWQPKRNNLCIAYGFELKD